MDRAVSLTTASMTGDIEQMNAADEVEQPKLDRL
jgi:hypothetical protein